MKQWLRELPVILAGNAIIALSVHIFILPYHILTGGVVGVAVALRPLFHLPELWVINGLEIGMFILGMVVLGKEFAIKTGISSLVYPLFLTILSAFSFDFELDPLLASIYGGLLAGVGVGMVMRVGASTGGMDIPPLILHRLTGIDTGKFLLLFDSLTICLGLFTYGLQSVLIGLFSAAATSLMVDKMLTIGGKSALAIQVISDQWQELNAQIMATLSRGTTLIESQGGYTGENKKMILVVIDKKQYPQLLDLIKRVDNKAFMITSPTQEVHGEGFNLHYRV